MRLNDIINLQQVKSYQADWNFDELELALFLQKFTSYSELITFIENNKHLENDKHVIFRLTELQNKLPTQLPHVSIY